MTISLDFAPGIDAITSLKPPYNPFLVVNGQRGHEVHLPGKSPSNYVSSSLFNTGDDQTIENQNFYYMGQNELPWALDFPEEWDYMIEKGIKDCKKKI